MSLVIRRMDPGDLDAAKRVILGVAARLFQPDGADAFVERWWLRLTDVDDWPRVYGPPRGTFLIALVDGRLVGTGAIRPIDDETAELKRMWLLEEYQGRGIGLRLFTLLSEFARAAGYRQMWLSTDAIAQSRAVRFYERLGFRPIPPYGDEKDTIFMGRSLDGRPIGRPSAAGESMSTTRINPPTLWDSAPVGFSQVVIAEGRRTVYCAGQVAWDTERQIGSEDLGEQARLALVNVERALAAAGGTLRDVVSLRVYVVGDHIRQATPLRQALLAAFDDDARPAMTWIGVAALANPDFVVEIEAVAVLD
ncbi:MAG: GNAT family N-acetyltransferase [Candidatus Promineofilum sp.]|nr:GNAT family N-acetyltransferase [Promineifilum sp.]